ncbi:MAG TPA: hypothetical protein VGJ73_09540 [Verrucomicrobiae bacterium]
MKKKLIILGCLLAGLFIRFGTDRASAQVIAFDSATNYAASAAWTNGSQAGFGFLPWQLTATNAANIFGGRYIDTGSLPISQATKTFGIYGNGSVHPGPFSFAYRELSTAMVPGEVFKVKCQVSGMNTSSTSPGYVGIALLPDDNTNWIDENIIGDALFAFYNVGDIDNCQIWDANGDNDTGILGTPITEQILNQGITIEFYLLTATTYQVVVKNAADTTILASYPASTLGGSGVLTLAAFEVNNGGGQNFWINNPEVASVSVVPPVISNLSPSNAQTYVTSGGQFSFNVNSQFSVISSNGISLVLNGINESNQLAITGSGTSNVQVTLNPPLQANVLYNGTISASDTNGNLSTQVFSFNTWDTEPQNIYIEGSDYNYGGGNWVNNLTAAEPNQIYGQFDLNGVSNIDYYVYNLQETNNTSPYRMGDFVFLEPTADIDHDNFQANGFTPYSMGYNEQGQWEDYTRVLSNNTYAVYARMAGFNGGTVAMSRMATPTVSTVSQPNATIGTFVCPDTGGITNWTFVPLKDFFSNPVLINYGGTNTFRITDLDGNGTYNLSYLILVAVTNTATVRPYISGGFPYPNATGVNPETTFSFTIANGQTGVTPSSIQLLINSNTVSGLSFSNNAAGTVVSYPIPTSNLLPAGVNTAQAIFSDGSVTITDSWTFSVETIPTLPGSWALPLTGNYSRGFSELIAKGDDSATNSDFPPSVARAEAQLAGTLTNSSTGLPYANEALNNGVYIETNTINYAVDSVFAGIFSPISPFPDVPAGTTNNVALEANMYAYLTPGVYNFDVYSDDGFQFTAGTTPTSTNLVLGSANFGRGATGTEFSFAVTNAGLYPMQLIYFKAQLGGGGVELYSVSSSGGNILLNSTNAAAVPVYYVSSVAAPTVSISLSGNQAVLSWSNSSYSLQSAAVVNGPYTTIAGSTSPYHYTFTGTQQFFRLIKTQ